MCVCVFVSHTSCYLLSPFADSNMVIASIFGKKRGREGGREGGRVGKEQAREGEGVTVGGDK